MDFAGHTLLNLGLLPYSGLILRMKMGIVTRSTCVVLAAMLLCSCKPESLGSLDVTKPSSTSVVSVADLFPSKKFDSLVITCAESGVDSLRSLMGFNWDKAGQAVPKDSGKQGIILISGTQVVAAGMNERTSVDFCSGTEFPIKLDQKSSLDGVLSGETWTVKWPKPSGK